MPTPSLPPKTNSAASASSSSSKDVVTIPGTEEALVKKAPAYKAWNFAYINIPGAYEKGLPSIYYISPPDPTWTKADAGCVCPRPREPALHLGPRGVPRPLHAISPRPPRQSEIGQLFVGYGFSEGWAHYTEEMMYDMGLGDDDPEMHIGQLQEALLRNVRFISAIGLHTQGMTVDESKRMFREKALSGRRRLPNSKPSAARSIRRT